MPSFDLPHLVGFEETNLVGNVYFVNYFRWQGRCREMFLKEKAPGVLDEIAHDLKLFTIKCECEYFAEVTAFDQLSIRMSLVDLTQTQIEFQFAYVKIDEKDETEHLIARGRQRVACMRGDGEQAKPARVPECLRQALEPYKAA
ncbi:acyl-CoA thioesterase [Streptomyces sp. NBC_00445]|uniref:acyl-CoA thioesterase n=1 Tax=unclassified Streptomyces TaxID=2593676 RepID=UPI002E1C94C6|nr:MULTISPECIES: acyl-CoA thioesterase [unclassified Streptomyces]